ncbi:hypothetical protein FHX08_005440 [Rhizobium sp. BK529]|nr:hypothetical protein [Rhizobium sp. BK529]
MPPDELAKQRNQRQSPVLDGRGHPKTTARGTPVGDHLLGFTEIREILRAADKYAVPSGVIVSNRALRSRSRTPSLPRIEGGKR